MSAKQVRAAAALLEGATAIQAAAIAGVSERTTRRWIASPEFQAHLKQHQAQVIGAVTMRLLAVSLKAVETLVQCLESEQEHSRRLAAADILRLAARFTEYEDVIPRIQELERRLNL